MRGEGLCARLQDRWRLQYNSKAAAGSLGLSACPHQPQPLEQRPRFGLVNACGAVLCCAHVQALVVLCDVAAHQLSPYAPQLAQQLLAEGAEGRLWEGKEGLLAALGALGAACASTLCVNPGGCGRHLGGESWLCLCSGWVRGGGGLRVAGGGGVLTVCSWWVAGRKEGGRAEGHLGGRVLTVVVFLVGVGVRGGGRAKM